MEGPPRKKWRQEPVACSLCRTKRLKCDRKTPCSNCISRGIPCKSQIELEDEQAMATSTKVPVKVSTSLKDVSILERLEHLERLVLGSQYGGKNVSTENPSRRELDSAYIESNKVARSSPSDRLPSETTMTAVVPSALVLPIPAAHVLPLTDSEGSRVLINIFLPSFSDAQKIAQVYSTKIFQLQHIVDLSAAAVQMQGIYDIVEKGRTPFLSHLALMLSMWAGATTFLHTPKFDHGYLTPAQASQMTKLWTDTAFDILDILRRRSVVDMEVVQARDLLGFVLFDTEAYTPRMAAEFALAISSLREIGVHRLDAPGQAADLSPRESELRRRLFWHIAATDWWAKL
jgi:hypothetical protein